MATQNKQSHEVRRALRALRSQLILVGVLSLGVTLLSLAPIGYMRDVYGPILDSRSEAALLWVTALLTLAVGVSIVVGWVRARVLSAIALRFQDSLGTRTFQATMVGQLKGHPGSRSALRDLSTIRRFIVSTPMVAMFEAPLGLIFLLLVFLINPYMGAITAIGTVVVALVAWRSEQKIRPLVSAGQQDFAGGLDLVSASGRNSLAAYAMGMGAAFQKRWEEMQDRFIHSQADASIIQAQGGALSKFVMLTQGSSVLGFGTLLIIAGVIHPQAGAYLIIAKILSAKAVAPIIQLTQSWSQVLAAKEAHERLQRYLNDNPAESKRMRLPPPSGELTLGNVSVNIPGTRQRLMAGLKVAVKPGRALALLGPSGGGKSSLAKVMVGLWAPSSGHVRLGGIDLTSWTKEDSGPSIGYLPQEIELFDGSLIDNICRFGSVDLNAVNKAVALAGITSLVQSLPSGLGSDIGLDGGILSGGEKQLVGLARAIYKDPHLIVLDEPDASLDVRGITTLLNCIKEMKKQGSVVVFVTHRLDLVKVADSAAIIANGGMRMYGPAHEIISKLEVFREERKVEM